MASVLYLSPGVFDKGGVSRYCRYQVEALRQLLESDEEVELLSLLPPDQHAFETPFRVSFASLGPSLRGKALFTAAAISGLVARPRVIWAAHLHFAPLALALARSIGAKVAVNVYGSEVWTNPTRTRIGAMRRADALLSDCHSTLRHIIDHRMGSGANATVHWDCVDTDRFCPGDPGDVLARYGVPVQAELKTVLTLARLNQQEGHKGVDRLLKTFERLRAEPVRLVVAGGGDWLPHLRSMVATLGLGGRVFFTGRVTEADLVDVYRAADLFVLLTTKGPHRGEGLPLTPIEAAACGKPLLVGNQDGSAEAVEHGATGFAVDPEDIDGAASIIGRILADCASAAAMGAAGRARVVREMAFPVFKNRLVPVLRNLRVTR